ncbi:hypothetical protein [Aequorivita capsosiphonis]|uniref:hypothetical protein n=1 Tax=Aequorivita capsosiphonis TaxID=487317 RepID=UPI00040FCB3A|nr:hypothetical protein [Aequorivita capsosiphonis]
MKKIFLFLFTLVLISCSSDDSPSEEQSGDEDLHISKLTEISNDRVSIRYYNEDGTIIKELGMNVGDNEDDRFYTRYEYDNQQNLKSLKFYSANDEFIRDYRTYEYDSSNRLIKLIDFGDGAHDPYITSFVYSNNRVDFEETITEKVGSILFDINGRITETRHQSSPSGLTIHFISYNSDNQVTEISQPSGTSYTFETNTTTNPLFQFFISKPMQYMLTEHYLYDIDFTFDTSYSVNNVTKFIESQNNFPVGTEETTFQFNNNNYPISSTTIRVNGSIIERTFEYY